MPSSKISAISTSQDLLVTIRAYEKKEGTGAPSRVADKLEKRNGGGKQ
jgi:hypothetical protein